MSIYSNFVQDIPKRCAEILSHLEPEALTIDREVTLLIAVASVGIIIPYERLISDNLKRSPHPSHDNQKFGLASKKFMELYDHDFLDSSLWGNSPESWHYGVISKVNLPLDDWPEMRNPSLVSKGEKAGAILKHIRNA